MKLTFISDTHSKHHNLACGSGDILIHCGDFTVDGSLKASGDFADYIAKQDFKHKVVIAGNHDTCFEDERRTDAERLLSDRGITYLNDSGIEIEGVKFWGSPIQPEFFDWAFNRARGAEIAKHWALIPSDTDILLTHGPAHGYLDRCHDGRRAGCEDLLATLQTIKPRIHACGHIHEGYGMRETEDTIFINACNLDLRYQLTNPAIELQI